MQTETPASDVVDAPVLEPSQNRAVAVANPIDRVSSAYERLSRGWPYLVLLIFTGALLWPLLTGKSLYWGDILLYFHEMTGFARETLRQGQLPLWNPYILCGQPYIGNPQSAVFYPTTTLLPFVPVWRFLSLVSLLHVFLCGAFAYCYLRRWTRSRLSSVAGALVYMGSACLIGRLQFPPMIQTAAYFPLLLACLDANVDAPGLRPALGLAATVALTLLAAHAQMAYLIFGCAFLYTGARLWGRTGKRKKEKGERRKSEPFSSVRWLCVFGVLGLMLASAALLPTLQLLRESPREQMTSSQANRFTLEPAYLITLVWPRFFGHPAIGDYWGGGNAWEPALFVGWLPLALIGLAVVKRYREGLVRFWAAVGLVNIWLAFGKMGGLYWLVFQVVPGLSNFHDPARFLFLTTFAFAVLTAVGLDVAQRHWPRRHLGLVAMPLIALPLWWYGQDWNPTAPPSLTEGKTEGVGRWALGVGEKQGPGARGQGLGESPTAQHPTPNAQRPLTDRVYLPEHDLYWKRFVTEGYRDYDAADARSIATVQNTLMPNLTMEQGWESASGYEPVPIHAPSALDGLARIALKRGEPNLSRLMALLDVHTLLLPEYMSFLDPRLSPMALSGGKGKGWSVRAWSNRDALSRAWMVRQVRWVNGRMRVAATLSAPDFRPDREAILSGYPTSEALAMEWSAERADTKPVEIVRRAATTIEMQADAGATSALLVYAATAYPGWKASVDGRQVPLYRADGALMGVVLRPGAHRVRLTYAPEVFRIGLFLSLLACGALATGVVVLAGQSWARRNGERALRGQKGNSRRMANLTAHSMDVGVEEA